VQDPKPIEDDSWTIENPSFLCPAVDEQISRNYPYGYNYQFLGNPRPGGKPPNKWIAWPIRRTGSRAT